MADGVITITIDEAFIKRVIARGKNKTEAKEAYIEFNPNYFTNGNSINNLSSYGRVKGNKFYFFSVYVGLDAASELKTSLESQGYENYDVNLIFALNTFNGIPVQHISGNFFSANNISSVDFSQCRNLTIQPIFDLSRNSNNVTTRFGNHPNLVIMSNKVKGINTESGPVEMFNIGQNPIYENIQYYCNRDIHGFPKENEVIEVPRPIKYLEGFDDFSTIDLRGFKYLQNAINNMHSLGSFFYDSYISLIDGNNTASLDLSSIDNERNSNKYRLHDIMYNNTKETFYVNKKTYNKVRFSNITIGGKINDIFQAFQGFEINNVTFKESNINITISSSFGYNNLSEVNIRTRPEVILDGGYKSTFGFNKNNNPGRNVRVLVKEYHFTYSSVTEPEYKTNYYIVIGTPKIDVEIRFIYNNNPKGSVKVEQIPKGKELNLDDIIKNQKDIYPTFTYNKLKYPNGTIKAENTKYTVQIQPRPVILDVYNNKTKKREYITKEIIAQSEQEIIIGQEGIKKFYGRVLPPGIPKYIEIYKMDNKIDENGNIIYKLDTNIPINLDEISYNNNVGAPPKYQTPWVNKSSINIGSKFKVSINKSNSNSYKTSIQVSPIFSREYKNTNTNTLYTQVETNSTSKISTNILTKHSGGVNMFSRARISRPKLRDRIIIDGIELKRDQEVVINPESGTITLNNKTILDKWDMKTKFPLILEPGYSKVSLICNDGETDSEVIAKLEWNNVYK